MKFQFRGKIINALIYIEPIRFYEIIILATASATCLTKRTMNATFGMTWRILKPKTVLVIVKAGSVTRKG